MNGVLDLSESVFVWSFDKQSDGLGVGTFLHKCVFILTLKKQHVYEMSISKP